MATGKQGSENEANSGTLFEMEVEEIADESSVIEIDVDSDEEEFVIDRAISNKLIPKEQSDRLRKMQQIKSVTTSSSSQPSIQSSSSIAKIPHDGPVVRPPSVRSPDKVYLDSNQLYALLLAKSGLSVRVNQVVDPTKVPSATSQQISHQSVKRIIDLTTDDEQLGASCSLSGSSQGQPGESLMHSGPRNSQAGPSLVKIGPKFIQPIVRCDRLPSSLSGTFVNEAAPANKNSYTGVIDLEADAPKKDKSKAKTSGKCSKKSSVSLLPQQTQRAGVVPKVINLLGTIKYTVDSAKEGQKKGGRRRKQSHSEILETADISFTTATSRSPIYVDSSPDKKKRNRREVPVRKASKRSSSPTFGRDTSIVKRLRTSASEVAKDSSRQSRSRQSADMSLSKLAPTQLETRKSRSGPTPPARRSAVSASKATSERELRSQASGAPSPPKQIKSKVSATAASSTHSSTPDPVSRPSTRNKSFEKIAPASNEDASSERTGSVEKKLALRSEIKSKNAADNPEPSSKHHVLSRRYSDILGSTVASKGNAVVISKSELQRNKNDNPRSKVREKSRTSAGRLMSNPIAQDAFIPVERIQPKPKGPSVIKGTYARLLLHQPIVALERLNIPGLSASLPYMGNSNRKAKEFELGLQKGCQTPFITYAQSSADDISIKPMKSIKGKGKPTINKDSKKNVPHIRGSSTTLKSSTSVFRGKESKTCTAKVITGKKAINKESKILTAKESKTSTGKNDKTSATNKMNTKESKIKIGKESKTNTAKVSKDTQKKDKPKEKKAPKAAKETAAQQNKSGSTTDKKDKGKKKLELMLDRIDIAKAAVYASSAQMEEPDLNTNPSHPESKVVAELDRDASAYVNEDPAGSEPHQEVLHNDNNESNLNLSDRQNDLELAAGDQDVTQVGKYSNDMDITGCGKDAIYPVDELGNQNEGYNGSNNAELIQNPSAKSSDTNMLDGVSSSSNLHATDSDDSVDGALLNSNRMADESDPFWDAIPDANEVVEKETVFQAIFTLSGTSVTEDVTAPTVGEAAEEGYAVEKKASVEDLQEMDEILLNIAVSDLQVMEAVEVRKSSSFTNITIALDEIPSDVNVAEMAAEEAVNVAQKNPSFDDLYISVDDDNGEQDLSRCSSFSSREAEDSDSDQGSNEPTKASADGVKPLHAVHENGESFDDLSEHDSCKDENVADFLDTIQEDEAESEMHDLRSLERTPWIANINLMGKTSSGDVTCCVCQLTFGKCAIDCLRHITEEHAFCEACTKSFDDILELQSHMLEVHNDDDDENGVKMKEVFMNIMAQVPADQNCELVTNDLMKRMEEPVNDNEFICLLCDKQEISEDEMVKHVMDMHLPGLSMILSTSI